jgi:hypothetical protein
LSAGIESLVMFDFPTIPSDVEGVLDALSKQSSPAKCCECNCAVIAIDITFFTPGSGSKAWVIPGQLCPNCQLLDAAELVPLADC